MPFSIEYSPESDKHFRALTARQRSMVLDTVDRQLADQPMTETRNRKRMRPNPLAPWELRIGDLRVYYDIQEIPAQSVYSRDWHQASPTSIYRSRGDGLVKNRTIQLKEAVEPLANYVRKIRGGAIVVMSKGRPIAAVISLKKADAETISLSQNPKFLSIIQRSRARQARDGGFSSSEMRRRLLKQL